MKTNIVGLKELREDTEKYISQIEKGRSFTVVRRSKPIFKISPVDEWGDEGVWETVADFRKINPKGVPVSDILKALKKLRG
jgi:antitoxin (DNA-binding transcriptional repressor) of toxin-antitoxin stability system